MKTTFFGTFYELVQLSCLSNIVLVLRLSGVYILVLAKQNPYFWPVYDPSYANIGYLRSVTSVGRQTRRSFVILALPGFAYLSFLDFYMIQFTQINSKITHCDWPSATRGNKRTVGRLFVRAYTTLYSFNNSLFLVILSRIKLGNFGLCGYSRSDLLLSPSAHA